LESLKPGKIQYLLALKKFISSVMTDSFWYRERGKKSLKIIFLAKYENNLFVFSVDVFAK
jgi:hypothetical protein